MEMTGKIVGTLAVLMGVGKFIPQIKLHWKSKSSEGLPSSFIISEMASFLLLGIFFISTGTEAIEIVIGAIGASLGVAAPLTLLVQKKVFGKQEKIEKEKEAIRKMQ